MHRIQSILRITLLLVLFSLATACQTSLSNTTASKSDHPVPRSPGTSPIAAVEWAVRDTLKTDGAPLDVAVSPDRRWTFVLTDRGNVLVYSASGGLQGRISVGRGVSGIQMGPEDETLLLISRENKTIRLIDIEFVRAIDIAGSPFRGPPDAPVVMVVFSDFQ